MSKPQPSPPPTASPLYHTLHATALSFIAAQTHIPNTNPTLRLNFPLLRSLCTPSFQHTWGHAYFVSTTPHLQGTYDIDAFMIHLARMLPRLENWETQVRDVVVDEARGVVVLRVGFAMRVKGAEEEETVENELMWVLKMEKWEGNMRVRRSTEFVDVAAVGRIAELGGRTR